MTLSLDVGTLVDLEFIYRLDIQGFLSCLYALVLAYNMGNPA
jgi:hypothetical protein